MEQFFRNIHEIGELSLENLVRTWLFHDDIVSFEYIAKNKVIDFYVIVQKKFYELIEKQITSYYPSAEVSVEEPIDIHPKGNKLKCYYAYQKNDYFFPLKTYKNLENDPLNDLTNIFSKLEETDIAAIQIIIRPKKGTKWQKKTEQAGIAMFSGKKPGGFKIPGLSFIGGFFSMMISGKPDASKSSEGGSGPYGGGGYVRMLQTREEIAKKIGEQAGHVVYDTTIRLVGSAEKAGHAVEITNNMALAFNMFKHAQMNWFKPEEHSIRFINTRSLISFHRRYSIQILQIGARSQSNKKSR